MDGRRQSVGIAITGNGEIIATSERYSSKDAAENGIESVRDNAADAPIEDETAEPADVLV